MVGGLQALSYDLHHIALLIVKIFLICSLLRGDICCVINYIVAIWNARMSIHFCGVRGWLDAHRRHNVFDERGFLYILDPSPKVELTCL